MTGILDWGDTPFVNYVGLNYIPYNIVINHRNVVTYIGDNVTDAIEASLIAMNNDLDSDGIPSEIDNCPQIYNPEQTDFDDDGIGDGCDSCDNFNIFVPGNLNGSIDVNDNSIWSNGAPVIDILDLLLLSDTVTGPQIENCTFSAANINGDNDINLLDIFTLAAIISQGL